MNNFLDFYKNNRGTILVIIWILAFLLIGFFILGQVSKRISNSTTASAINKDVASMISKGRYELMMEVKDEGNTLQIYTSGNEKIIESFVFTASDGDSIQFICIDGEMNRSDIEKLIVSSM